MSKPEYLVISLTICYILHCIIVYDRFQLSIQFILSSIEAFMFVLLVKRAIFQLMFLIYCLMIGGFIFGQHLQQLTKLLHETGNKLDGIQSTRLKRKNG